MLNAHQMHHIAFETFIFQEEDDDDERFNKLYVTLTRITMRFKTFLYFSLRILFY